MADTSDQSVEQTVGFLPPLPGAPPVVDCPTDTVQLFQFSRAHFAPSLSPFVVKVETYLRLAKIPYQTDLYQRRSPQTGKLPWIRYNGTEVSDSTLIIDFLNKKCGVDLNKGLTVEQRAVCTAIERMVDEHLFWILACAKWINDKGFEHTRAIMAESMGGNPELPEMIRPKVKEVTGMQGIGRHSEDAILEFCEMDMKAISDFLGDKPFMMGANPSQVDCAVFGCLAEFLWSTKDDWTDRLIPDKFPNLEQYCQRMKDTAWPDWDDCITHGGTRVAKK